jgi:hypothetical protein
LELAALMLSSFRSTLAGLGPCARLALGSLTLTTVAGCASFGQSVLCVVRGPINAPSNYSLRRSIMQHGLGQLCHEMTTHEAPIALAAGMPSTGRFFPKNCVQSTLPNGDLFVQFDGFGYAFTPLSKKLTFTMSGAVEYDQDFRVGPDCDIFAYFRTKNVKSSNFQTHIVEQPVASFLNSLTSLSSDVGKQLVSGKLADGFTVIQDNHQNYDFTLGLLPEGQKPQHPFEVHGEGRIRYESARSEVHQDQRDFIGPIEIADSGRSIYVDATLDGIPAVDVIVMRKEDAEVSLGLYFNYPQTGPLDANILYDDVVTTGHPYSQGFKVPKGSYYIVIDNTPTAGRVGPPPVVTLLDDHTAALSYSVAIGDEK